jgi:hypothetical protein
VRANLPPCPFLAPTFLHNHFILIAGALAWLSPLAMSAQSVTFTGASPSVNFGKVNLCPAGQTTTPPCSEAMTLTYNVTEGGTLGTPKVLTQGAPNLDFTLASGSSCTGSVTASTTCTVNVKFTPRFPGSRPGGVQITGESGNVLATTLIYGLGVGPQIGFNPSPQVLLPAKELNSALSSVMDGAGNVFIADSRNDRIVELPAGGGPQVTLASLGLDDPYGIAVDGAGDLFVTYSVIGASEASLVELPSGGGTPQTISSDLLGPRQVTVDAAGDVFVADSDYDGTLVPGRVLEFPIGGGSPITVGTGWTDPQGIAVDAAGNVFVLDAGYFYFGAIEPLVVEVPAGGGPQFTISQTGGYALAVDAANDLFLAGNPVLELPGGGGGLIPAFTPPASVSAIFGVAVNAAGDLLATATSYVGRSSPSQVFDVRLSAAPTLNFGTTSFGSTLPLTISNTGNSTLTLTPSFSDPSYQLLSEQPDTCLPSISPGKNCTLQIEFLPATAGPHSGVLTLQSNAATSPTVSLQGSAIVDTPMLSLASGVYATAQSVSITDATSGAKIYYTTNGTVPTASSTPYTGAISVNSTETLTAVGFFESEPSALTAATYTIAPGTPSNVLNFSQGFAGSEGPIQFNGSAKTSIRAPVTTLQLTDPLYGLHQIGSAFFATPVDIESFTTDFTFQITNPVADGFTFTVQNIAASALGNYGGALGYAPIGKSVAVKFDLHNNVGEGPNSTGLYVDGAMPTVPAIDLTGTGIDLHSGDAIFAQIAYDGTNLVLTLTNTATFARWSHSFAIDIPATVGGDTAYIGFTGSDGIETADQEILSWTYVSGTPGPSAPPPPLPPTPGYPAGFNAVGLATNGNAAISGSALQLTDGGQKEAGRAFYVMPVTIDQSFTTDFTFQLSNPSIPQATIADGFTFTILNAEPYIVAASYNALGGEGGALGFAGIVNNMSGGYNNFDMAIKFDLHNNSGEGPNSTGLYVNGASPTTPSIDLTGTGIDLHSGHPFQAQIVYDYAATSLSLTLTDTITLAAWSHSFTIDIPTTIGGTTAYIGFTGATGFDVAVQKILNWTFTTP